jgi:hypothetical protein
MGRRLDMKRTLAVTALTAAIGLQALVPSLSAAEALVGTWRLARQELNGQAGDFEPLTLQVSQAGDKFSFAFSMPVNEIYFVTLTYTLRLDGSGADIKNANGQKIGTIQMMRAAGQYTFNMKGPGRPESQGTLTVSADGKMLISESNATQSGRPIHSKQTFTRY